MSVKPHAIRFHDDDWRLLEQIARQCHLTGRGELINAILAQWAESQGHEWEGRAQWGGARRSLETEKELE